MKDAILKIAFAKQFMDKQLKLPFSQKHTRQDTEFWFVLCALQGLQFSELATIFVFFVFATHASSAEPVLKNLMAFRTVVKPGFSFRSFCADLVVRAE